MITRVVPGGHQTARAYGAEPAAEKLDDQALRQAQEHSGAVAAYELVYAALGA